MTETKGNVCPECNGKKVISGACSCDMEWRGSKTGDELEDCQCAPEVTCPTCEGKGYMEAQILIALYYSVP